MTTTAEKKSLKLSLSQLGPGLLMAGAAIGVSHLVQSTRAGAMYGWGALGFVLLANLMKYPFYEYGHRYAAASGQNLIQAYRQQGKRFFVPFLMISTLNAVGSFAVDAFVAAMLLQYLYLPQVPETVLAVGVLLLCWGLIAVGRYRLFEQITKWCVIFLAIATIAAVIMAVTASVMTSSITTSSAMTSSAMTSSTVEVAAATIVSSASSKASLFSWQAVPFIVAFMGWMPGGLELSVWQSLWVQANDQDSGAATSLDSASFDFNFGYILTVLLACLFLTLGTLTLPGQGLAAEPATFAGELVGMYTGYIGAWAKPLIGLCAIAAIFSTTFTVIDAFPRMLEAGLYELTPAAKATTFPIRQAIALTLIFLATLLLILFTAGFEPLINSITIIAFVTAPFYAWLNIRSIATLADTDQPQPWLTKLATVGLIYLSGFSLLFITLEVFTHIR